MPLINRQTEKTEFSLEAASLNRDLDRNASLVRLNEQYLENRLEMVESLCHRITSEADAAAYWLTLARITELTLYCAGNYANNLEFTAAGDLLVNPRLILVHARNADRPVKKQRHMKLTDQFAYVGETSRDVKKWLKTETTLEIKKPPLLPCLYEMMRSSDRLDLSYIQSVYKRMGEIADAVSFLNTCHIKPGSCLHDYLAGLSPADRRYAKSRLCDFDLDVFHQFGDLIRMQ